MSTRKLGVAFLAVVISVALAASAAMARPTTPTQTELKIALFPSLDYAPLFVGLKRNIFKKAGLEIKITYVYTGSGLMAALTSGQTDMATNSVAAGANAIINGLPIKLLTVADYQPIKKNTEVLVQSSSSIKTWADLAGKTVATINLRGLFHLGVAAALEAAGGDPASIKAVPMSPADEPNALLAGRVDAIVIQDPFLTVAKENNPSLRSIGNPFGALPYRILAGAFYTSKAAIESKAPALRAFKKAWTEATVLSNKNLTLTRQIVPKYYAGLAPGLVGRITLPEYTSGAPAKAIGPMLRQIRKYGWIAADVPDYGSIVWDGK
jgi:NitT/TauT family transport system substrate-binding protein